jgi:hypothetical protein
MNRLAFSVMLAYHFRQLTHPTTRRFRKARKAERQNRRIGRLHNGRK